MYNNKKVQKTVLNIIYSQKFQSIEGQYRQTWSYFSAYYLPTLPSLKFVETPCVQNSGNWSVYKSYSLGSTPIFYFNKHCLCV